MSGFLGLVGEKAETLSVFCAMGRGVAHLSAKSFKALSARDEMATIKIPESGASFGIHIKFQGVVMGFVETGADATSDVFRQGVHSGRGVWGFSCEWKRSGQHRPALQGFLKKRPQTLIETTAFASSFSVFDCHVPS